MKTKRLITRWLAVALCLVVSLVASPYDFMEGGIAYIINSDGTSVTVTYETSVSDRTTPSYSNASGTLVIPSSIYHNGRNYVVTAIGERAFQNCKGFTGTLSIPNSVTTIGKYAFAACSGFTGTLTIPNSVTIIGEQSFYDCSGFTGTLTIPNSVTSIGRSAFCYCLGLSKIEVTSGNPKYDSRNNCNAIIETSSNTLILGCKSTIVPNTVKIIGGGAFMELSLESINLPEGVECIEEGAFAFATIGSIYLPVSLASLKRFAFDNSRTGKTYIPDLNAYCKINVEPDGGNYASPIPGGDLYVGGRTRA